MVQEAKIYIAEALISLMEHQTLEEIHIKDIVKRAGVSRMSYYRYFTAKEEILQFYMQYLFDEYMEQVERSEDFVFRSYEHIRRSLEFFQQYKAYARCLHKAGMNGIMLDALNTYIRSLPTFDESKATRAYPLYFYAGALYNVYIEWILNDDGTTPEQLARIISRWELK